MKHLPGHEEQQNYTFGILHMQITLVDEGFTEKSSQVGNVLVERVHTG
jgi:hypothetical protein